MLRQFSQYLMLWCVIIPLSVAGERPLQPLIDAAAAGSTLRLPPGRYSGPVLINKPLTIDGAGKVTIDGGGVGTVITIATDGARLSNLHITGSGDHHNELNAGILVSGKFNVIKDNRLDDVLFGIALHQSEYAVVKRNHIRSKERQLAQRGDGIRIWYSVGNKVIQNRVEDARDVIILDSKENYLAENQVSGGRYSLHVVNSQGTQIIANRFIENEAGIFALKANGLVIRQNLVAEIRDVTGVGIGLKESSSALIEENRILNVMVGIALDLSPEDHDLPNFVRSNLIAHNTVGIQFLSDRGGNHLSGNRFLNNYLPIAVRNGGGAMKNEWAENYWSDYAGFDQNSDGAGDTPYELYAYADQLWLDFPGTQFFVASPTFSLLDFLERLAPFTEPRLMVRDTNPRFSIDRQAPSVTQENSVSTCSFC
ncbi:MAG: nitrous oxide reductase family maturation protein NosD [Sedimenticola sp.]|nr:nitrous oxide reductase family maturation protein NosD [Sedimenticola sp.]MDF1527786.1 nitrous oxide reductase family maturation protein NosD [Sedimenticola sp.]